MSSSVSLGGPFIVMIRAESKIIVGSIEVWRKWWTSFYILISEVKIGEEQLTMLPNFIYIYIYD